MIISEELKELIKDRIDPAALVASLGFRITRSTSSEVRAPCIIHGGDNPTAFSMRVETKKWKCFTKKCEMSNDGKTDNDIIALTMKVLGLSFIDALQFLADYVGLGVDVRASTSEISPEYYQKKDIDRFVKRSLKVAKPLRPSPRIEDNTILSYVKARDSYFLDQGFSEEILDRFEIGLMTDRWGIPRASIPIRDDKGVLVGVSLRRTDGDEEPRYLLDWSLEKDKILYNLFSAKQTDASYLIIVEGFKACWAVVEAGYSNVVACMGSVVTEGQLSLLEISRYMSCILLLDGDSAGRDGMERSIPRLSRLMKTVPLYLPDDLSPDSFSRDELKELINTYSLLM